MARAYRQLKRSQMPYNAAPEYYYSILWDKYADCKECDVGSPDPNPQSTIQGAAYQGAPVVDLRPTYDGVPPQTGLRLEVDDLQVLKDELKQFLVEPAALKQSKSAGAYINQRLKQLFYRPYGLMEKRLARMWGERLGEAEAAPTEAEAHAHQE